MTALIGLKDNLQQARLAVRFNPGTADDDLVAGQLAKLYQAGVDLVLVTGRDPHRVAQVADLALEPATRARRMTGIADTIKALRHHQADVLLVNIDVLVEHPIEQLRKHLHQWSLVGLEVETPMERQRAEWVADFVVARDPELLADLPEQVVGFEVLDPSVEGAPDARQRYLVENDEMEFETLLALVTMLGERSAR